MVSILNEPSLPGCFLNKSDGDIRRKLSSKITCWLSSVKIMLCVSVFEAIVHLQQVVPALVGGTGGRTRGLQPRVLQGSW